MWVIISQEYNFEKTFEDGTLGLDDTESTEMFSKTFVEENLTRKYLQHLNTYDWKKKSGL